MEESQIKHDEQEDVKVTKGQEEEEEEEKEEEEGEELQESLLSHAPSPSETPRFDEIFHKYDTGYGSFGTENLASLLLEMGYPTAPKVIDHALDQLDPDATGEITKLTFLEWFEEHADELEELSYSHNNSNVTTGNFTGVNRIEGEEEQNELNHLTNAMFLAKTERKKAEADVFLLSNRLAYLKAEEKKTRKQIEEATKRAKELEAIKKRNKEHQRIKQAQLEQSRQEVDEISQANYYNKRIQQKQKQKRAQKQLLAQQQKQRQQEQVLKNQLELVRLEESQKIHTKAQEIRQQERIATQKRLKKKIEKEKELVHNTRQRLAKEFEKKIKSHQLIEEMEKEETLWIEKLRKLQILQRETFENLEFLMHSS